MKRLAAAIVLASCAMPTLANTAYLKGNIQRTLVQEGKYGGCMIMLDKNIADAGLNCPSNLVSLDCDGAYGSKASAQRAFDSAQMAFALDREVSVQVDDSKKHNNYCVGIRVDVLR